MRTIRSIKTLRRFLRQAKRQGKTVGFVPTMGFLHTGHCSLLRKCRKENDVVVLSIFVNPKQFGKNEDFSQYPRDLKHDEILAKKENVDIMFHPSEKEMYPTGHRTEVKVKELSEMLCGRFRPGHFAGVATVVAKLINIVAPDGIYLGQKDAQQAVIIRRMVQDLNFPTMIKVLPTVREKDGLAMSSRNSYLDPTQRSQAPILYQALTAAKTAILKGERNPRTVCDMVRSLIRAKTESPIDYVACIDAETLQPLKTIRGTVLIALAVWFGKARLIDNILVRPS